MTTDDDYEIAVIDNEADARASAELLAEAFANYNALSVFNYRTSEVLFDKWLWPSAQNVLGQKLSFLMRHRPTNEIVAAIFARDYFLLQETYPYDASAPASPTPDPDLYHEMAHQFIHDDFKQELKPNMVLYIEAVGVRPQYAGKGLLTRLNAHVCEHARSQRGYQYIFVQTSHPATRHMYVKKMHGEETRVVDPAAWVWKQHGDGSSRPLKDYVGEPAVNILVKL